MPSPQIGSCDILIIGAGLTGLAIAAELPPGKEIILAETHPKFGQETSSRNSEVVHSGIYYPKDSRKTAWCLEGRRLLYAYCQRQSIPFRKAGKIVVATQPSEVEYLEKLATHSHALGVSYRKLSGREVSELEPLVAADAGILFPESGIVDSHELMASLLRHFERRGGVVAYRHEVRGIRRDGEEWFTALESPQGLMTLKSRWVINAAGLAAAELSNVALETGDYEHRFCRGAYLQLGSSYRNRFRHLVYPVPSKDGLGIHVTLDLEGNARLGPDVEWCTGVRYDDRTRLYEIDWEERKKLFLLAVRRYLPVVHAESLSAGLVGIRPKLFVRGEARPDFLVENHHRFVHCLGIESPGLTASLAMACAVRDMVGRGEG